MEITPDIRVLQSQLWDTNTGIVRGPMGDLLIDPGIFPEEMESISAEAKDVVGGFCTHAHWDHVLWDTRFGSEVPRFAAPETIALIQKDRERILNNLTKTEAYLGETGQTEGEELWDRSMLFAEQPIAWGEGSIAGISVELIPIPGHEDGQAALLLPDHRVCFVADTLSDIEIPSVHDGTRSIALYLQTLDRLESVISRVDWIIPGHGAPCSPDEAMKRLNADRAYLQFLIPAVNNADAEEGTEDLARRILLELGEERALPGLSWSMHLENIQQLIMERTRRAQNLPVRKSSRLILLDPETRVWMFRINDPIRPRWILPGGGVEEGETHEQAALRELWEECAIDDTELGPMVGIRESEALINLIPKPAGMQEIEPAWIHTYEQYYLVRLGEKQPGNANMFEYETADYTRQEWFTAEDIRASNEVVYPLGLADLLDQLKRGEVPFEPIVWMD